MSGLHGNPGSYVPMSGTFTKANNVSNNLTLQTNLHDTHYRSNGFRDSYIMHNNGGFMTHESPMKQLKSELVMSGRFVPQRSPSKGLGDIAKVVHYRSDGKGRDTYISKTDGGLTFPNKPCDPRVTFKKHLRRYERLENYAHQRQHALATASGSNTVFGRLSFPLVSPRTSLQQS